MPDTIADIITNIEKTEGGSKVTNDPSDPGGRTQYGISEKSNPEAWADGIVTEQEARDIYMRKYFRGPHFDQINDYGLQSQLTDFGVLSGPGIAIKKLQEVLNVPIDGILGPNTLMILNASNPKVIGNRLALARIKMLCKIVQNNPTQLIYLSGWVSRSMEFYRE
jgi:lysozyme family protein